jgi:phosphocarrier protein
MKSFEYTITDEVGIHARPAGILVKEAKAYESKITLTTSAGKSADVRKLMALMSLGVKQGETVTVSAEGADEDTAIAGMETFFKENL